MKLVSANSFPSSGLADLPLHRMAEQFASIQITQSSDQSTSIRPLTDKIAVSLCPYVDQHR